MRPRAGTAVECYYIVFSYEFLPTTRDGSAFHFDVRIPPNTRATIRLPRATLAQVTEGAKPVASANGVTSAAQDGDAVVVEIGSGDYVFTYHHGRN